MRIQLCTMQIIRNQTSKMGLHGRLRQNGCGETRDLAETTELRPLCITDLFQNNKSVAYFQFIIFFQVSKFFFFYFILCNFLVRTLQCFLKEFKVIF